MTFVLMQPRELDSKYHVGQGDRDSPVDPKVRRQIIGVR